MLIMVRVLVHIDDGDDHEDDEVDDGDDDNGEHIVVAPRRQVSVAAQGVRKVAAAKQNYKQRHKYTNYKTPNRVRIEPGKSK